MKRTLSTLALFATLAGAGLVQAAGSTRGASPHAQPAPPVIKTAALRISVYNDKGRPSAGTLVEVTQSRGKGLATQHKTDAGGHVYLSGMEAGSYLIVAFNADRSNFDWRMIDIKPGRNATVLLSTAVPPVE